MKKLLCITMSLALCLLAACGSSASQPPSPSSPADAIAAPEIVIFTDPVLEVMVRGSMGKPSGNITAAEAEAVTRLNLNNEWQHYISEEATIHDITGLEYFANLESLDLSFNEVTDITPLSGLKNLTLLSLNGNPINDIKPLVELTDLKVLILSGCVAKDYSPLSNLVNLNLLMLDNSGLTDVSPLISLTNLKYLYLAGCPINSYFPLSNIYQSLEHKDFTIAFTLAELGFIMDSGGKQAICDGKSESVRINHIEWGAPPEDWLKNCVRTVFVQNDYKIDIGYYPNFDAYVMMANKDGNLAMNYVYYHTKNNFTFGKGNRESSEKTMRVIFSDVDDEDILLTPIHIFHDTLAEMLGISADTLFEMPFDETDDTLPSPYERLGFTMLDFKATCLYEEQTPHELNISVHRSEWDEAAPAENLVDWSMEFNDSDVNGYRLHILYYEAEGKYRVTIEKDGVQASFENRPAMGERGWEWPDLDTAHQMFNDAFGTVGKELYDKPLNYFEKVVQDRFGMSINELYALPVRK